MISYGRETWADCNAELQELFPLHWKEIAHNQAEIPLDVNVDAYAEHEANERLHIMVVRSGEKLIGYHICIVGMHMHYNSTPMAFTDIFFVLPEYRKGFVGINLFKETEKSLRGFGVKKIFIGTKHEIDCGPIFKRLGYSPAETTYSKYIG